MYKAMVPLALAAALGALGYFGVTGSMTVEDAVTLIIASGLVWLVPNKK